MTQVLPKPVPRARPYWRLLFLIPSLATLGVGLYYRRYAEEGLENFFLAGRSVPGWLNGVSYAAAMVSADAATAYGGLAVVT